VVICLERGADLHVAQLMPLPLTVSCFSKIQIGLPFLVPAHLGCSGKRAVKRVCVCLWSRKCYISTYMSAWQGSAVPCQLLHTGHRCCRQAASQVSHTATYGGATTSAIHCWTPSIRCAQSCGLELLARRPPCTAGL